ncbi:MAG: caspase family protein [Cyanobacteriota bacterium]|nr:caspase family protein [Cyanobacteriota bacterium]
MQNWAIVIGINHYEHLSQDKDLKCAVKDAEAMKSFLCKNAGFQPNNILFCSDNSQSQGNVSTRPTRTNIRRILLEKIRSADGADNFLFFFAGHGISKNYQDYLLPCDGYPYDEGSAVSVQFIANCLRSCRAKNIVLILDMCREAKPQSIGSRGATEIGQETIQITRQQGIITIFSCQIGEESYEIAELNQGAFTYVFLKGLQQHLNLRQLEQYLIQEVPALNSKHRKPVQVPLIIPEPGFKYDLPLLIGDKAQEPSAKPDNSNSVTPGGLQSESGPSLKTCINCKGSGEQRKIRYSGSVGFTYTDELELCATCGGMGQVPSSMRKGFLGLRNLVDCWNCGRSGIAYNSVYTHCPGCGKNLFPQKR